jgi:hypothetical protein
LRFGLETTFRKKLESISSVDEKLGMTIKAKVGDVGSLEKLLQGGGD